MAEILGRHRSSIKKEIERNSNKKGEYNPYGAQVFAICRRRELERYKVNKDKELKKYIEEKLKIYWSPETISVMWNEGNPNNRISHSTIYRSIKRHLFDEISAKKHLRRRGKKKYERGASATIKPEKTIHERPKIANDRSRIGDWEGDTVMGGRNKGLLVTHVDRKSRYLIAEKAINKQAETVEAAIIKSFKGKDVKTVTLDQGSEFANFKSFEKELKTTIYFADPHSPWQRGTNENTNDILRFFFPKGTNFLAISDEEIQQVVNLINERPRKCLGWKSPKQILCCT